MTTKVKLLRIIREHCLECCGGMPSEVEKCTAGPDAAPYSTCTLWPYRMGKDPTPNPNKVEAARRENHLGIKSLKMS